ncbi:MAG: DUF2628 domain-containing protein [Alphaproteobacteria bacterium]|nr:DUF2628 domain-containing protein [Alphaproteobacteria bacterium]
MQIYSIFEPATGAARLDDPRSVIFLKERFCWPALFVPLLWMLYHRMWLVTAGYIALSVAVGMIGQILGSQEAPAAVIGLGFGLIVAFEANGLRRWYLQRSGFRQVATVAADTLPQAEARYFVGRPAVPQVQTVAPRSAFVSDFERRHPSTGWGFMAPDQHR